MKGGKRTIEANVAGRGLCRIGFSNGYIEDVQALGPEQEGDLWCWRGFVDIQINGFAGVDFAAEFCGPDELGSVLGPLYSTGVTCFLPTLVTNRLETLAKQFQALEETRAKFPLFARSVPGYHLEGPWLSAGPSHGAHDPELMRLPDWQDFEMLQRAAGGRICLLTVAPELPGALELIERATANAVVVAVGHTDGTTEDIYRASAAGATLATHLGNGCPTVAGSSYRALLGPIGR